MTVTFIFVSAGINARKHDAKNVFGSNSWLRSSGCLECECLYIVPYCIGPTPLFTEKYRPEPELEPRVSRLMYECSTDRATQAYTVLLFKF